jgi:hypothetical protein
LFILLGFHLDDAKSLLRSDLHLEARILMLGLAAAPVRAAEETKTVKGTVSAVAGDTVSVQVADKLMVFKVDKSTDIIARGGSTATRQGEAAGQGGAKLSDVVKVGEGVEVRYKEAGGVMQATQIRGGVSVPAKTEAKEVSEKKNATGKITAVTGNGLTVNSGGKDMKFVYDAKSRIEGTGMTTKTKELEKLGKAPTLPDFLAVNDEVSVEYTEAAGVMHATEVRLIKKAR